MRGQNYKIIEESNIIDDHFLDIFGNEFKFDHPKGLAEWIKNSVAAYIRTGTSEDERIIYLRFSDSDKEMATIECIDFVGMTSDQIINAFKRWGDPEAAKYGYKKRVPGGHGNGGKFYMRQMFRESYFITYVNNKLNIYGFSQNKKYGFANNFKNISMKPKEAVKFADIATLPIPGEIFEKIITGKTGFTVVRGIAPLGMINKIQSYRMCEKIRNHPQVRKYLERIHVGVIHNNNVIFDRILPDKLEPKPGFEKSFVYEIPNILFYLENGEKQKVEMANKEYPAGKLLLKTSAEALERGSKFGELNGIDILGESDVIAFYYMYELGVSLYPQSVFIYGECKCPILEDPNDDCVKNDRSKLIAENPKTKALLQWIGEKVNELAKKILDKEREEQKKLQKEHSKSYNDLLNRWSTKFLNKIRAELLTELGTRGFGFGRGDSSEDLENDNNGKRGGNRKIISNKKGSGDKTKRQPRSPIVLLSGIDADPFSETGETLYLDPRQGIIYQRIQDVKEGIHWINTASPLAKAVLERFSEQSQQWRSYLFQRHVDILIKEEMRNLFRRDAERFNPDVIDAEIFRSFMLKVQENAAKDLENFLLSDHYDPSQEK
jgi:hypothetical protein